MDSESFKNRLNQFILNVLFKEAKSRKDPPKCIINLTKVQIKKPKKQGVNISPEKGPWCEALYFAW